MAEFVFDHHITYNVKKSSSVADVASSLLANERLIRYAVIALENCIEGFNIDSVDIKVDKVSQQSPLSEILITTLFLTYQRDLTTTIPALIEHCLGINTSDKYKPLVTIMVMAIAIYGAEAVIKSITPNKNTENLNKEYCRITYLLGDYISITPEKIDSSIKNIFLGPAKNQAKKTSIDFFRPAKKENAEILGPLGLKISNLAVQETPNDFDISLEDELEQYPIQNVNIEIRALDKDRKKQGWYAVVRDVTKKRLKMQIYPSIDPNSIFGHDKINGDIIVISKKNSDGDYIPSMYHLVKINRIL